MAETPDAEPVLGSGATRFLSVERRGLPDPVLLEDGDILVPVHDTDAPDGASVTRLTPEDDDYVYWLGRAQEAVHRRTPTRTLRDVGGFLVVVGSVALIGSMFLRYVHVGGVADGVLSQQSLWELTTRMPVILTILAATALVTTGVSFFLDLQHRGISLAVTAISLFALGESFPLAPDSYTIFAAGFWIGVAGAAIMSIGSALVVAGQGGSD